MLLEDVKKLLRGSVLSLRKELTPANKDVLAKLSEDNSKLKYDGKSVTPDISKAANNYLSQKADGLFSASAYVTSESSPVGEIIAFMGKTAPSHYLACDGTVYNIGTYPHLESFIQTHFGNVNYFGGDGTTTFAVPDLRGEFLRGSGVNSHQNAVLNTLEGSGGNVGDHQGATITSPIGISYESSNTYISVAEKAAIWMGYADADSASALTAGNAFVAKSGINANSRNQYMTSRPTNTSVLYCIKYEPTWTNAEGGGDTEAELTEADMNAIVAYVLAPKTTEESEV